MGFGKRSQHFLPLLVFFCCLGCMEAIKRSPRRALFYDSQLQDANRKGASIEDVEAVESHSVLTEEAEMLEEGRILFAEGNGLMGNTLDYPPTGPNPKHDPRVPHPFVDESATKTKN